MVASAPAITFTPRKPLNSMGTVKVKVEGTPAKSNATTSSALSKEQGTMKNNKTKVNIEMKGKGGRVQLTGLQNHFKGDDANHIAQGVAYVIEADGSGEDVLGHGSLKDGNKIEGDKEPKPESKVKQEKADHQSSGDAMHQAILNSGRKESTNVNHQESMNTETVDAGQQDIENAEAPQIEGKAEGANDMHDVAYTGTEIEPQRPGISVDPKPMVHQQSQNPITSMTEPEMDSVSVIGNLASAASNTMNSINQVGGISDLDAPPIETKHPLHSSLYAMQVQKHKQRLMNNHINSMGGDSIGVPVSDMLPGVNVGIPTDIDPNPGDLHENNQLDTGLPSLPPHDQYEHNMQSESTAYGQQQKPGNPELPINRLTDYDILDVDLEGLGSMPKQTALQQTGVDRSLMSQGPNLENPIQGKLS